MTPTPGPRMNWPRAIRRPREAALRALAGWDDAASVELLASQMGKDADHGLRLLAVQLLGDCTHPRAAALLPKLRSSTATRPYVWPRSRVCGSAWAKAICVRSIWRWPPKRPTSAGGGAGVGGAGGARRPGAGPADRRPRRQNGRGPPGGAARAGARPRPQLARCGPPGPHVAIQRRALDGPVRASFSGGCLPMSGCKPPCAAGARTRTPTCGGSLFF